MSLKNKALILIGSLLVTLTIYKLWPKSTPQAAPNTYTLIFFDKTLSNNYGDIEINNHKTVLQKVTENLRDKGDKIKVFYIDAITESASNKTPQAEVDFALNIPEDGGYIDKKNAEREFEKNLYKLKVQTKEDLLKHFDTKGEKKFSSYTDTWGLLNRLRIEANSIKANDKLNVLIFSDMEESMKPANGRRDFTKNKIEDIQNAIKIAEEDIATIKKLYALDSISYADNINVKLYFPKAKVGKSEMEVYWIKIFNAFNINIEVNS
jgi:DNA-binding transcriptional ArsR family regulator